MPETDATGRRARIDAVFDAALDLPVSKRAAFLDDACAGDPELRREVEDLLGHVDRPLTALDPGALAGKRSWASLFPAASAATDRSGIADGTLVGNWRIVREIGRGGMGSVYLVERADGQFEQRAALKLIHLGDDSTMNVRRFARERQILATLTHPNIARLLDGGQGPDGRPYLVMELVEGRPIDRYCDDERLGVEGRLALFGQVCRAVEHAHRNLVIHRDLKPSNIVVTDGGEVKLLDFGIATVAALGDGGPAARHTRVRALTPEYASPEQIAGDPVGTPSDVYQMGLLLSELLTGEPVRRLPTPESSPLVALERWMETPSPPSVRAAEAPLEATQARRTTAAALARRQRGDLDAMVLYALRREPERRHSSVAEMAEDVERHLAGRPVRARPDSLGYRTSRFVKRYRRALAAGVALLAVGGLGLHSWSQERLRVAREAERALQIENILGELFSLPNPRRGASPPEARDLVDHANRLVSRELGENPDSQARLLTILGRVYNALGLYEPSLAALERAAALARDAFGPGSPEEREALRWMAQSQHYAGDLLAAERTLLRVLDGDGHELERGRPDALEATLELADLQHSLGRLVAAEATLRRLLAFLERQGREDGARARALRDLGNVLRDRGAWSDSETAYRESLRILGSLPPPVDQQVATVEIYLARLLTVQGRWEEAEALLERGSSTLRRVYGSEHPLTGTAARNLAHLRIEQGRFGEAEEHLRRAREVIHEFLGPAHPMVARARVHEAELALRRGRYREAVALAESSISLLRTLGIGEHPSSLDACRTLAEALLRLGDPERAGRVLEPCARAGEGLFMAGDPRLRRDRELSASVAAARAAAR